MRPLCSACPGLRGSCPPQPQPVRPARKGSGRASEYRRPLCPLAEPSIKRHFCVKRRFFTKNLQFRKTEELIVWPGACYSLTKIFSKANFLIKGTKKDIQREDQNHRRQHLRPERSTGTAVGHRPDAHAHPDGGADPAGRCHRPPCRCICSCTGRRQNVHLCSGKPGGICRVLCSLFL